MTRLEEKRSTLDAAIKDFDDALDDLPADPTPEDAENLAELFETVQIAASDYGLEADKLLGTSDVASKLHQVLSYAARIVAFYTYNRALQASGDVATNTLEAIGDLLGATRAELRILLSEAETLEDNIEEEADTTFLLYRELALALGGVVPRLDDGSAGYRSYGTYAAAEAARINGEIPEDFPVLVVVDETRGDTAQVYRAIQNPSTSINTTMLAYRFPRYNGVVGDATQADADLQALLVQAQQALADAEAIENEIAGFEAALANADAANTTASELIALAQQVRVAINNIVADLGSTNALIRSIEGLTTSVWSTRTHTNSYEGTGSMLSHKPRIGVGSGSVERVFPIIGSIDDGLAPGKKFAVLARLRAADRGGDHTLSVSVDFGGVTISDGEIGGGTSAQVDLLQVNTDFWLLDNITVPANATSVKIKFEGNVASGFVEFDDVRLIEAPYIKDRWKFFRTENQLTIEREGERVGLVTLAGVEGTLLERIDPANPPSDFENDKLYIESGAPDKIVYRDSLSGTWVRVSGASFSPSGLLAPVFDTITVVTSSPTVGEEITVNVFFDLGTGGLPDIMTATYGGKLANVTWPNFLQNQAIVTFTPTTAGTVTLVLKANNASGTTTDSVEITITQSGAVKITSIGVADATVEPGEDIEWTVSTVGTQPISFDTLEVSFDGGAYQAVDPGDISSPDSLTRVVNWTTVGEGDYTLRAVVSNNGGADTDSGTNTASAQAAGGTDPFRYFGDDTVNLLLADPATQEAAILAMTSVQDPDPYGGFTISHSNSPPYSYPYYAVRESLAGSDTIQFTLNGGLPTNWNSVLVTVSGQTYRLYRGGQAIGTVNYVAQA